MFKNIQPTKHSFQPLEYIQHRKIIQVIKSIQHIQPIKSTHPFKDIQSQNIIENFRAIIIDDIFLSDNFVEIFTFLSPKIPIYLLCHIKNHVALITFLQRTRFF